MDSEALLNVKSKAAVVIGLAALSVAAVFISFTLSLRLNLRGLATPNQERLGLLSWLIISVLLVSSSVYAAAKDRGRIPRWLVFTAWGLFIYSWAQVVLVYLFTMLWPPALGDQGALAVVLTAGVVGVYTSTSAAGEAMRVARRKLLLLHSLGILTTVLLTVLAVWACLYLE